MNKFTSIQGSKFYCILLLCAVVMSVPSTIAQVVTVKLEIPPRLGLESSDPFDMSLQADPLTGKPTLIGTYSFTLVGNENMIVQITLNKNEYLVTDHQQKIPVPVTLCYRNDNNLAAGPYPGEGKHCLNPGVWSATFPLNNGGRLIQNMLDHPEELHSRVFITASIEVPEFNDMTFSGNFEVLIEYN